jgi:hypothetical protein
MTTLHCDADDRKRRLTELGLTQGLLRDALLAGELMRDMTTSHHPRGFGGLVAWGWIVAALRDRLVPLDWVPSDERNYPVVLNPNAPVAIAVATGDDGTGIATAIPQTRHPKGDATTEAIAVNRDQLGLFVEETPTDAGASPLSDSDRLTWILLFNRKGDVLRAELSLPSSLTADGRPNGWTERVLLDEIRLDGPSSGARIGDEPVPILDVPVERKLGSA